MEDYPDSEEEFELMYGDELELLREQNEEVPHAAGRKSRKSLDFTTPTSKKKSQPSTSTQLTKSTQPEPCSSSSLNLLENSFERDFRQLNDDDTGINSKKRGVSDLFGDIDDIILEEQSNLAKKVKRSKSEKLAEQLVLIDRIVERRKLAREKQNPNISVGYARKSVSDLEHIKNNVSHRVPKYPFIGVTSHDGERIYVRMHSEEYELEDIRRITSNSSCTGFLGKNSKELWVKANEILNQQLEEDFTEKKEEMEVEESDNSKLWVDMYKPRRYIELLSDESTNRTLLKWLKLWDKVVFKRRPRVKLAGPDHSSSTNPNFKFNSKTNFSKFPKKELDLTLDSDDRPVYKVALLCGPPGLGKTTLAHLVAKHAGYNVVEVNASDERNIDSFKTALENATQMKSVIDSEGRPNCLVFDEIDGAPPASIDFLVKFVNGTVPRKGKKGAKTVLKRPIICICNDVYVPALKPLRQIALILNFPPIGSARLAERLVEISRYQSLKVDMAAMLALSEKSQNDIRSCLSILHFLKSKNKPVTLSEISRVNVGQKDMQKGLFAVWQEVFEIKKPKSGGADDMPLSVRASSILKTVTAFGDYERLTQGIFENYPAVKHKGSPLTPVCTALDWFSYTDCLSRKIHETQNYGLEPYFPYGFVVWHLVFASYTKKKINYPAVSYEVNLKQNKISAIVSEILRGMPNHLRSYVSGDSLKLDIIPLFVDILVPNLRTINVSLYAPHEKVEINNVVSIMIDYNLTYVQERNFEGSYIFYMDPNIDDIINFEGLKVQRRVLSYTSKQMLAREIEVEKMRRMERLTQKEEDKENKQENCGVTAGRKNVGQNVEKADKKTGHKVQEKKSGTDKEEVQGKEEEAKNPAVPNHLQKLKAKAYFKTKEVISKDFFGRVITKPAKPKFGEQSNHVHTSDIWFQYKEGYNNAVKRKIKIKSLF